MRYDLKTKRRILSRNSFNRFLGRVNDKGSAYREFLIMTGIANHLTQVNFDS